MEWIRIMDWRTKTSISFGNYANPTHDQKETIALFCALHKIDNPFKEE